MKAKESYAVEMKHRLQTAAEKKLSGLSEKDQLRLLERKFGHLRKSRKPAKVA